MVRPVVVVFLALSIAGPRLARAGDPPDPTPDPGTPPPAPDAGAPDPDATAPDAPPALDPKEAKRFLAAGDTLIKRGDQLAHRGKAAEAQSQYERALIAYQRAQELSGNPQVFFAIAAAEEKLGHKKEAILAYRKVTELVTDKPELITLATDRLGTLGQDVGLFTAVVDPVGAQLALDGTSVGTSPMTDPLVLAPGNYTLTITADGFQPMEVKLIIEAGSESERTFKLEPVPMVFDKPKEAPRPIPRDAGPPAPSRGVLWAGTLTTVALAGVATTTGVLALKRHQTFADTTALPADRDHARDQGKKLSLATDICLAGAVIAAGITTYYYFGVYRPKARAHAGRHNRERPGDARIEQESPKIVVAPWVQSSTGGLALAVTY